MPRFNKKAPRPLNQPVILPSAPEVPLTEDAAEAVNALMNTADNAIGPWRAKKTIRQEVEYTQVLEVGKVVKSLLNKATDQRDHFLDPFKEGMARIKGHFAQIIDPLKSDEKHLKALAIEYTEHQRTKAIAAAEKKAERLEAEGLDEMAEDVRDLAIVADVTPVVEGVSYRENWSAKVVDERAVLTAILEGRVPMAAIKFNMPSLNALARARKEEVTIDGVKFVCKKTAALKGA